MDNPTSNKEKITESWVSMLGSVVHDLNGSLATVRLQTGILEDALPNLLNAYQLACENELVKAEINKKHLNFLNNSFGENIKAQITKIGNSVNSLYEHVDLITSEPSKKITLSALKCIDKTIQNYDGFDGHNEIIAVDKNYDFNFDCQPVFIETLLNTFIDYAVNNMKTSREASRDGKVIIWLEQKNNRNTINIKIANAEINTWALSYIFREFMPKNDKSRSIPGIALCRLAILFMGGDVSYEILEESHIQLCIAFPMISA